MKRSWLKIVIGLAIILRIGLAITTYHSDLGAFALAGKYIAGEGKWLSFYDTIASKDESGTLVVHRDDMIFNYQPLAYVIPSIIYLPFSNAVRETGDKLITREWISSNPSNINLVLLLYKLPMLLADLGILWLLPKLFSKKKHQDLSRLIWAINPLAIYVSSMMGQVDIVIAFLILISLFFAQKNMFIKASIFVALSALIKPIGLIVIPLYAIAKYHDNKNLLKAALVAATGAGVYVLGILPYIGSASYRHFALFAEQIGKSTHAAISIASGHDIPLFFIVLALSYLLFWSKKISLLQALFAVLLSSLAFTHFHPQWLVWLMPLAIIIGIAQDDLFGYLVLIACWFVVLFSFDATLSFQLFIHSQLDFPTALRASSLFKELIQIARAGIIATLIWSFTQKVSSEKTSS